MDESLQFTLEEFLTLLDRGGGRMVDLGLKREAMVSLADTLARMLSKDPFNPNEPYPKDLHRLTVHLTHRLASLGPTPLSSQSP